MERAGTTVTPMWQMMDLLYAHKKDMVAPEDALPGRAGYPYALAREHLVLGTDMLGPEAPVDPQPWPAGTEKTQRARLSGMAEKEAIERRSSGCE